MNSLAQIVSSLITPSVVSYDLSSLLDTWSNDREAVRASWSDDVDAALFVRDCNRAEVEVSA